MPTNERTQGAAREIAEALFKPKQITTDDHLVEPVTADSRELVRAPRILKAEPGEPIAHVEHAPQAIESQVVDISASEHGRIRALATYGMTIRQVAAFYEVSAAEIERIVKS